MEWLSSHHVIADIDTLATTEELLEAVFSVRSVLRLYNENQLSLQVSRGTADRRGGGWCEVAARLG
jgi:hypothetical protein